MTTLKLDDLERFWEMEKMKSSLTRNCHMQGELYIDGRFMVVIRFK